MTGESLFQFRTISDTRIECRKCKFAMENFPERDRPVVRFPRKAGRTGGGRNHSASGVKYRMDYT